MGLESHRRMSQRVLARGGPLPILQSRLPHGGCRDVCYVTVYLSMLEGWPQTLIGLCWSRASRDVASESRAR